MVYTICTGDNAKQASMKTRSKKLKSLEEKGCVHIVEKSNKGILVKICLPNEIPAIQNQEQVDKQIDIEQLDFYTDRRLLTYLLAREGNRCFYTGRKLSSENCYLDHVIPQAQGGNNSYQNIVVTSFDANSMKNDKPADEFACFLYKEELISLIEFNELKEKISKLQSGQLVPDIGIVRATIYS